MQFLTTLLSFFAVIALVVFVHEYGHFLAARLCKVRVLKFSIGFGKPLCYWQDKRGTIWVLAPILLGGYVRLLDKDAFRQLKLPPKWAEEAVEKSTHLQRIFIYAAGPLANFVLSLGITLALLAGGQQGLRPLVDGVRENSAAAAAGLVQGDEITRINGEEIALWQHVETALVDGILSEAPITIHTQNGGEHTLHGDHLAALEAHGSSSQALGITPYLRHLKLTIASVVEDSPADRAGLRASDALVMMNDTVLDHWHDAMAAIENSSGSPLTVVVWRSGAPLTMTVIPDSVRQGGRTYGQIGVWPMVEPEALRDMVVTQRYTIPQWIGASVKQTGGDIARVVIFLRLLFSARVSKDQVSGPVGIARQSGMAARLGPEVWLRFVSLISISLGIINLLPIPMLDGGQIVLNVIEWARRRELAGIALRLWNTCGALIILSLMSFAIINDFLQLFF